MHHDKDVFASRAEHGAAIDRCLNDDQGALRGREPLVHHRCGGHRASHGDHESRDRGCAARGGSTWQSLARGASTLEVDYLNGEIAMLGRVNSVPTPVNEALRRIVADEARRGAKPGELPLAELVAASMHTGFDKRRDSCISTRPVSCRFDCARATRRRA